MPLVLKDNIIKEIKAIEEKIKANKEKDKELFKKLDFQS